MYITTPLTVAATSGETIVIVQTSAQEGQTQAKESVSPLADSAMFRYAPNESPCSGQAGAT